MADRNTGPRRRAWEYVVSVAAWYKGHISGWLLAIVAIGLNIAAAFFVNDPSKSAMVVIVSARLVAAAAVWVLLVAQYDAWRAERTRVLELEQKLMPKIRIGDLERSVWPSNPRVRTGAGYHFHVWNLSNNESLENVRVEIVDIKPDIPYPPLPLPMHIKNDDYRVREFSVNPGADRQIDIVTGPVNDPKCSQGFCIVHTVTEEQTLVPDEKVKYRITVRVTARNASPETAAFEAWVEDRELRCMRL